MITFSKKRVAVDTNEDLWSGEVCKENALESIKESIEEEDAENTLIEEFEDSIEYRSFEDQGDWINWLHQKCEFSTDGDTNGEYFFGTDYIDYAPNMGIVESYFRHEAILAAIKMIDEQLRNNISIQSSLIDEEKEKNTSSPKIS